MKLSGMLTVVFSTALLVGYAVLGQAPVAGGQAVSDPQALLSQHRYEDVLKALEAPLRVAPDDGALNLAKVKALMGLGRYSDAARICVAQAAKHADLPEYRYRAGECALRMGLIQPALSCWSALYHDDEWSGRAYRMSAQTLLSMGKREEAQKLLQDAIMAPKPSAGALLMYLEVNPSVKDGLAAIDKLFVADPGHAEDFAALRKIYETVGSGELFQESAKEQGPITMPLKELSERQEISSLHWGSMDSGTATYTLSSRLVIQASLQGSKKKKYLMLDSGSECALVTQETAKELGLEPIASASYVGLGYLGAQKSNWVILKGIDFGGVVIKNVPAMVIDGKADFWKETAGLVPLSLFEKHGILMDRRHDKLTLFPPGTKPEQAMPGGSFSVKSCWYDGKPFVQMKVQDKPGCFFLLDTGAYTTFLAAEHAGDIGLHVNQAAETRKGIGMSGTYASGVANDATIWLGPARFKLSQIDVIEIGDDYDVDCYGLLGRNVLDQFELYFDYSQNVVAFQPYPR